MNPRRLFTFPTIAFLASLGASAALAGGACGDSVPSDQGAGGSRSSSSSTTTTTTTTSTTTSSTGTGGMGTGGAGTGGMGTGGAPDCYPNPMTYVEIINACTTAQQVDVTPVLPLLQADGGLPPLP
jgi:hypothetical protein